jgi:hypothetical protein
MFIYLKNVEKYYKTVKESDLIVYL